MGDLNLRPVVDILRLVRGELEAGEVLREEEITTNVRNALLNGTFEQEIENLLQGLRSYGPETASPAQEREQFKATAEELRNTVMERLRPMIRADAATLQRLT